MQVEIAKELNAGEIYRDLIGEAYTQGVNLYFPAIQNGNMIEVRKISKQNALYKAFLERGKELIGRTDTSFLTAWEYIHLLLETSPCYVEYGEIGGYLRKMVCCNNLDLLQNYPKSVKKHKAEEVTHVEQYEDEIVSFKLNPTKLTVTKGMQMIGMTIRVVPLIILRMSSSLVQERMEQEIWRYSYYKDTGQTRSIIVSGEKGLREFYTAERAEQVMQGVSFDDAELTKCGYVKVPEIGLSKYDKTGVRALNLTKIYRAERVTKDEIAEEVSRYKEANFALIGQEVDRCISQMDGTELHRVVQGLKLAVNPYSYGQILKPVSILRSQIAEEIQTNIIKRTTEYLRELYVYCKSNPELFPDFDVEREQDEEAEYIGHIW